MVNFTHLHVHSHYSVLDGMSKVPDLINKAMKTGMYALALTDHGNKYGIKDFMDTAKSVNGKTKDKIKEQEKILAKEDATEETLMDVALEAGAEDIKTSAEGFEVITAPETFEAVKTALEGKNIKLASAEITMLPSNEVEVTDVEAASKIVRLIETLDEHDDTKEVYSNDKISEEVLAKIEEK